ncbi:MAG: hypothetical protein AAFY39_09735 [Pseudomonadota bacterium]
MPRRIILHAGFHKTGTSTVQAFLRANRKTLMPVLAIRLKGQMQDLMRTTRQHSSQRDPFSLAQVAQAFDAVLADLPAMPKRTLLLSAEELSGHMPGRPRVAHYAAPDLAEVYAATISARFPGIDTAFYFTTRDADTWLESAYWEHVKSSSMTMDLPDFVAGNRRSADLNQVARQVQDATGCPVTCAPLDGADGIIAPLLDLCGIPTDLQAKLTPVPPANTRLPHDVLLALLDANRAYPDRTDRKAAKQAILSQKATP